MINLSIKFRFFSFCVLLIFFSVFLHCQKTESEQQKNTGTDIKQKDFERIISLSPSTTEILFALGLGDKVVGVTKFCNYPLEAQAKSKVGGYIDPNYEAIASLRPDIVFILPEYDNIQSYLNEFGIHFVSVSNKTINDILDGIETIGKVCSVEDQSREMIAKIHSQIEEIRVKIDDTKKPRVLYSVMRNIGTGSLEEVYAAGGNTYFNEILSLAGATNVLENQTAAYPLVSAEGIIHLNPDFIIDTITGMDRKNLNIEQIQSEWNCVPDIHAVRARRIFVLSADYAVIPGPRFILLLKDIARFIHPEINWDKQ